MTNPVYYIWEAVGVAVPKGDKGEKCKEKTQ